MNGCAECIAVDVQRDVVFVEIIHEQFRVEVADHLVPGHGTSAGAVDHAVEPAATVLVGGINFFVSVARHGVQMKPDLGTRTLQTGKHPGDHGRCCRSDDIRQGDDLHAAAVEKVNPLQHEFGTPRITVRRSECHRNINHRCFVFFQADILQGIYGFYRFFNGCVEVLFQKSCGKRKRKSDVSDLVP